VETLRGEVVAEKVCDRQLACVVTIGGIVWVNTRDLDEFLEELDDIHLLHVSEHDGRSEMCEVQSCAILPRRVVAGKIL